MRAIPELREEVAVAVRAAWWRRRAVVTLDMRVCAAHHVWRAIERVHPLLPRGASLRLLTSVAAAGDETSISVSARAAARALMLS